MRAMTAGLAKAAKRPVDEGKQALLSALSTRFGDRFSLSQALREQHANTLTWLGCEPPDAVVFAETEAEVSEVVKLCAASRVPIIPFGTGTSLEGHVNAPFGGISLDLSRMKRILAVHEADLDCMVEPGVTRKALNDHLRDSGLFFPVDPGADASLGGMAATRASGTNAVRYGTMRDLVLGLSAVLADGSVIQTGGRARTILSAVCPFTSIEGACNATIAALQMGLPLARIELADEVQIRACNAYSHLNLPEVPTLFLEFHGTAQSTREQVEAFAEIARGEGGGEFKWAERPEDRSKLWQARHDAYWAARGLRPGTEVLSTDVCVPISALADCVTATRRDIDSLGLLAPIVGHVGDGNFHVMPLIDPADPEERRKVQGFLDRLIDRALGFGGTCTGEHGIGEGKISYLRTEHGAAVEVMIAIKKALDPLNILNPGKIFALA
jgi:D-lactate dehydrogenase (cytochrome)